MHSLRTLLLSLSLGSLFACGGNHEATDSGETSSPIRAGNVRAGGSIAYGETKSVSYAGSPPYKSLSFVAQARDYVVIDAHAELTRSSHPVVGCATLTDANYRPLTFQGSHDNGTPGGDSHIEFEIPAAGSYFILLSEYNRNEARFTVSLTNGSHASAPWLADLRAGGSTSYGADAVVNLVELWSPDASGVLTRTPLPPGHAHLGIEYRNDAQRGWGWYVKPWTSDFDAFPIDDAKIADDGSFSASGVQFNNPSPPREVSIAGQVLPRRVVEVSYSYIIRYSNGGSFSRVPTSVIRFHLESGL